MSTHRKVSADYRLRTPTTYQLRQASSSNALQKLKTITNYNTPLNYFSITSTPVVIISALFTLLRTYNSVVDKPMHKKLVHAKVNQAYGYIGGEVNLTCEAVAEPAAVFTWFRPYRKLTTMPGRIIQRSHWSILQVCTCLWRHFPNETANCSEVITHVSVAIIVFYQNLSCDWQIFGKIYYQW